VIVVALVGPAGTGKSHRASFVAQAYGLEGIIDDGLFIMNGHIVAGVSAKKEETSMAAVRRAVFSDPEHAAAVRRALAQQRPGGVLILGTSRHMVERIADTLDLPRPERVLQIEEIATPEEIRRARQHRRLEGRHVIPAPTVEVQPSFSGYLVDPLRLLFRGDGREPVIEKSVVRPTFSALGRFFVAESAVAAIVEHACLQVPEVVEARRGRVEMVPSGVHLSVELGLRLGCRVPSALAEAQQRAKAMVEHMTALNVLSLDVIARRLVSL